MVSEDHPVRKVLEKIVADTKITAEQVRELENFISEDWIIDELEAEVLFRVNKALGSNEDDCPEWTEFFLRSICKLVVMEMSSPGEIDQSEGDWLGEMFEKYSVENESQEKLLFELQKSTTSIEGKIAEKIQPID